MFGMIVVGCFFVHFFGLWRGFAVSFGMVMFVGFFFLL